jgi:tRNA (guanine-N7-)-methyltransferase
MNSLFAQYQFKLFGRRKGRPLSPLKSGLKSTYMDRIGLTNFQQAEDFYRQSGGLCYLEIGFGSGEHLVRQLAANPAICMIGCEPFENGVADCISHLNEHPESLVNRTRLWDDNALKLINHLSPNLCDRIFLLYPDPWPKKRHHERRFIQESTLKRLHHILKESGEFYFASDHADYREWVLGHIARTPYFSVAERDITQPFLGWASTRYEMKAKRAGRESRYYILTPNKLND